MHRGIITLFGCWALGACSLATAQQTTIINHYLGDAPGDGQMMQYVLRSSEQHAVVINYYEPASEGDEGRLAKLIADALDFYVDRSVLFDGRRITLRNKPQAMHRDLEQIVRDAVRYYHFHDVHSFEGFSRQLTTLLTAMNGVEPDSGFNPEFIGGSAHDRRFFFVENKINEVKQLLRNEVGLFAGNNLLVQVDSHHEDLGARQDSLLAAVRGFRTNDPLNPIDIQFSHETLNLLAGDDAFVLPTFNESNSENLEGSDLADRILAMLEDQNRRFDELRSEVEEERREQRRRDEERRREDLQMMQEQIDLLRELITAIASDRSANAPLAAATAPPAMGKPSALPTSGFNVIFGVGSSAIDLNTRLRLNEVIEVLATRSDLRVMLTGFADATGNRETNLRLSKLRAAAVRDYLLKSGLPAHRVIINFFGDAHATGEALDRRVEVRFIDRD